MAKVLDTQTMQVVELPDEQVGEGVASGRYTLPKGDVAVVDSTGRAGFVPAEQAAQAFAQGYRFRTAEELEAERQQELYGDRAVAAGVAGAARGLTLGASDAVLTEIGAVQPETLRGLQEQNEAASLAGEVVGSVAPVLVTGGAAAPAAVAARAGAAAGRGVAARVGGRALVREAVGGVVEGGLQGLGQAISDDALEREPLTAEKALADIGMGALLGGAGGAAVGKVADAFTGRASRELAGEVADALPSGGRASGAATPPPPSPGAPGAAGGLPPEGPPGVPPVAGAGGAGTPPGGGAGGPPPGGTPPGGTPPSGGGTPPEGPDVGGIADAALGLAMPFKRAVEENPGVVRRILQTMDSQVDLGGLLDADTWVLKGLDAKTKHLKRLNEKGLMEAAPALLRADPRFNAVKNGEQAAQLAATIKEETGQEVRNMAKRLDSQATEDELFDVQAFARRVEEEVLPKLSKGTRDQRAAAARVREELELLLDSAKLDAVELPAAQPIRREAGEYVVDISELDDLPATYNRKGARESILKGLEEGKELPPIKVSDAGDGMRTLVDGQHRLAAYRERGITKVRVRFDSPEAASFVPGRKPETSTFRPDKLPEGLREQDLRAPMEREGWQDPFTPRSIPINPEAPPSYRKLSFAEAEEFKRALDASVYDRTNNTMTGDALRALRAVLNKSQEETAERIGKRLGDDTFERWKAAKRKFGAAAELDRIGVDRMEVAKTANRTFSLTDNIAGAAGFAVGGGLNPAGLALSMGAAVLNKWGRENLPFIIAKALSEYNGSPGVRKAANALRKRLGKGGPDGAGGTPAPTPPSPSTPGGGGGAAALGEQVEEALVETLRKASTLGPAETWVTHTLLSGSVEYRDAMERRGMARYTPEADAEGQRRAEAMARVEAAAARFDAASDAAVSGLLSGKRPPLRPLTREAAIRRAEELLVAARSPEALVESLASTLSSVGADVPGLASAMQETAQRGVAFLASKAPARPVGPLGDIPALRQPWQPSEVELERWGAYLQAVERPLSVLEDAARGTLTREGVEALQAVYPALYADLQGRVLERLTSHKGTLTYAQRVALGQVLGMELDESMQPGTLAGLQSLYQQQPEKPQGRPNASSSRTQKRLAQEFSEADRLATS